MNLTKIRKQLDKIHRTVQFLSEEDELTQVEKDLLLDYVRALYGTIQDEAVSHSELPVIEEKVAEKPAPPVVEVPEPEPQEEESPADEDEYASISPALSAVFAKKEATDLSDKLSLAPIKDLTKVMSINEKIFTVNELFSGNQGAFNSCLEKINGLPDYDQAVAYLSKDIAPQFGWDDEGRLKKVEQFMVLVQRRFA